MYGDPCGGVQKYTHITFSCEKGWFLLIFNILLKKQKP